MNNTIFKSKIRETLRFGALFLAYMVLLALFAGAFVLAPATLLTGCASAGESQSGDAVFTVVQRVYGSFQTSRGPATGSSGAEAGVSSGVAGSSSSTTEHTEHTEENPGSPSSSYSPVLDFRYGGVKGKPAEDSRCRISKLRIGSDSLSFRWDTGIPSDWKTGDTGKGPMVLSCAFYEDGGKWVGGKFDWIDTARSSRSLENIHGGYNGWNAGAWNAAKKRAFCVVSADGRLRSNLLEETR